MPTASPAVELPKLRFSRVGQNRRRTIFLLLGALLAVTPFALAWCYCLAQGASYVFSSRGNAPVSPWTAIALAVPVLVVPVGLFCQLAFSSRRMLAFCGEVSTMPATQARQILERLAAKAGVPVPRLYVLESHAPNAFAAGMKPSQAIIAITRGLIDLLDPREMEAVLAYELSQIGNCDTRWNTARTAIGLFLRLPFPAHKPRDMQRRHLRGAQRNPFGLLLLPFAPVIVLTAPLLAIVLHATAKPARKTDEDREAVRLSGDPAALLTALVKIKVSGEAIPKSDPVIGHHYFVDPVPVGPGGISRGQLFIAHPPIDDRIAAMNELAGSGAEPLAERAIDLAHDFAERRAGLLDYEIETHDLDAHHAGFRVETDRTCKAQRVTQAANVYKSDSTTSEVVGQVQPGELVIAFDQTGTRQQIVTADGKFGFLASNVKLKATDRLPQDVLQGNDQPPSEFLRLRPRDRKLTQWELMLAIVFGIVVFVAVVSLMSLMHHR